MTNNDLHNEASTLLDVFKEVKNEKDEFVRWALDSEKSTTEAYQTMSDFLYETDITSTDTRYTMAVEALESIISYASYANDEDVPEDMPDALRETLDGHTPIYNSDIMQFITENPNEVDEVADEFGIESMYSSGIVRAGMTAYAVTLERLADRLYTRILNDFEQ